MEYLSQMTTDRKHFPVLSSLDQELLTFLEHMSSLPILVGSVLLDL